MTVSRKLTLSKNRIALITGINLETRSVTFQEEMRIIAKIHSIAILCNKIINCYYFFKSNI